MPPTLILVRHAQALHNVDNYEIHDPDLSELGYEQCKELRTHLQTKLPKELDIGLIVVSPMRRTVQTALRSLDWLLDKKIPIIANADWQETSEKPCDTGSPVSALETEFPEVNFKDVDPVYPDKTSPAGSRYRCNKAAIVGRAQDALAALYGRTEKAIIVVSHSGFLRQGVTGNWFFNADYRIFDFEEMGSGENNDGESGTYRLKQWEITKLGGMGWSREVTVGIGEGIPEEDAGEPPVA